MKKLLPFFLLMMLMTTGCATHNIGTSFVGEVPKQNIENIAQTATSMIVDLHAPGQTSVYLEKSSDKTANAFDVAFENALRAKGFQISPHNNTNTIKIGYTLDIINYDKDKGEVPAWYLQLRLSSGQTFARAFTEGGMPESVTTVLGGK